ncbi:hypothetical protein [Actinokineospora bangkokensis]|uniref:Uncharacterized protein n=1 Tax=Actinokineospora bangkokensis TaxID=1193682 RepID=A0A1Q9LDK4_9PSEU|nr:hypothetical protein BJP25_03705 [Actinokineospora bangkokensis]
MTPGQRLRYTGLLLLSAVLAVYELIFLPLRLDGTALPEVGDAPFPVTILVAAVTSPWLVVRAARLTRKASVAGGPLYAWLAVLLAFLVFTPGGDEVVVADWRTLLLLAAGAFPATVKIGDVLARSTIASVRDGSPSGTVRDGSARAASPSGTAHERSGDG